MDDCFILLREEALTPICARDKYLKKKKKREKKKTVNATV